MKNLSAAVAGPAAGDPESARPCSPPATASGTATLELANKATDRKITTELWFKAGGNAKIEWFSPRPPLRSIPIARNADPEPPLRKHPLIVISHGNWGTRFSQGWLALELVKSGYVVLSASHPGTVGDDQSVAGRYRLWDRSRDVSFALGEVLERPKMGGAYRRNPHRIRRALVRWVDWCEPGRRQIRPGATKNILREGVEKGLLLRRNPERRYRRSVRKGCGRIASGTPGSGHLSMASGPGQGFVAEVAEHRSAFRSWWTRLNCDEILEPLDN